MSDLTPPELTLPDAPKRDRRIVWMAVGSLVLHAGVLGFLLWPPLRDSAEAAPPPAIEVELVPPPEVSSSQPPPSSSEVPSSVEPSSDAPESSEQPSAAPSAPSSAETSSAPAPSSAASSAEASSQDPPSSAEASTATPEAPSSAAPSASAASASAASEPPRASQASSEPPPTPMSRPMVIPVGPSEEAAAASSGAEDGVSALTASTGELADGAAPAAASEEPDAEALGLGAPHSAKHFYLEAMLSAPNMARAREMLKTLPREKRLSQTCNIEALAQIGNAGRGFSPDVVMSDAYAKSVMAGPRFMAAGAIFRSEQKWYGVAFDCTLSEDLTTVTAFSYRLGADVTQAVVARLGKTQ